MDRVAAFVGQASLPDVPYKLSTSHDGNSFFTVDMGGGVRQWLADSLELLQELPIPDAAVGDLAVSPQDDLVAATFRKQAAQVFRISNGEKTHELYDSQSPRCLAFSADGSSLVGGSISGTLRVYDLKSGKLTRKFSAHDDNIYSLQFSSNGKILASSSSDQTVRLWSWPELEPLQTLKVHSSSVRRGSLSPDNRLVAAGNRRLSAGAAKSPIHQLRSAIHPE